ncbi:MAG: hypothetical protein MJ179_02665 [Treponema sp.]|nr:hypothetical protein [Treponema sp.]
MDNETERKIEQLEKKLDDLPAQITKSIAETMDLKITNAMQKIKLDFYAWLVPIILGLLGTMAGLVYSFIIK